MVFFPFQDKSLNSNSSRSYQLHALWSYTLFRLVSSCEPVPTEVQSQVQCLESGVGDELPHLILIKCHIFMYMAFPFCQIYSIIFHVPVPPSYHKVSLFFFFFLIYKLQLLINCSLKKTSAGV